MHCRHILLIPAAPIAYPSLASTKNRYLAIIKRLLSLSAKRGWVSNAFSIEKLEEPRVRVHWETQPVVTNLIKAISMGWLREAAMFAVSTGMRAGKILSLT
jgi:integrase